MKNETKQTAVDFLMDKLFDPSMMVDEQLKWFEQAKEMEKQRMIEFARLYVKSDSIYCGGEFDIEKDAEHFYNETYGGSK